MKGSKKMNEDTLCKLKEWVTENYKRYSTSWGGSRNDDGYGFSNGQEYARSWAAFDIGNILGMELDAPEAPIYKDY